VPHDRDRRVKPTSVRHGLCFSCDLGDRGGGVGGAMLTASPGGARGAGAEVEFGLPGLGQWRGLEQLCDGAAEHQVGLDEPCEGERAGDDPGGLVGEAQQHEGDQRDRDLNADGVFRGSQEVADLQGLFDPSEEQLDRPSPLVEVGDLLRARLDVVGEDAQHLAGLDRNPDLAASIGICLAAVMSLTLDGVTIR